MSKINHYRVKADRITSEWIGEPEYQDCVDKEEWARKEDTRDEHYDTYEEPIKDEYGMVSANTETRAITVIWVD